MKSIGVLFDLLRVKQWTKNLLIYAALVFTSNLFNPIYFRSVTIGFFLLCFAASSLYIFNDLADYESDRLHPQKRNRPIASNKVNKIFALSLAILLMSFSLIGAYFLNFSFFILIICYLTMTTLYTLFLKHIVIVDVFILSIGFVLRAIAGALVLSVSISPWLLICTLLLALFLALAKRRNELTIPDAHKHRKILEEYSIPLLDEMISVVTASTVIAYSLYTFYSPTAVKHSYLMLTIPFVLYGIFRYLYLIHKKNMGGSPEAILLKDLPIMINVILFVLTTIIIVYFVK
ncbi:MAG: decaprenyl-phosphate phosphoribosyltransferase [bacterium]